MNAERFAPIPGLEGRYEVSRNGTIRSLERDIQHGYNHRATKHVGGNSLVPCVRPDGSESVMLPSEPVLSCGRMVPQKRKTIASIVYRAWVGPLPEGHIAKFVDTGPGDLADHLFAIPRSLNMLLNSNVERARDRGEKELDRLISEAPRPRS